MSVSAQLTNLILNYNFSAVSVKVSCSAKIMRLVAYLPPHFLDNDLKTLSQ